MTQEDEVGALRKKNPSLRAELTQARQLIEKLQAELALVKHWERGTLPDHVGMLVLYRERQRRQQEADHLKHLADGLGAV